MVVIVTVQEIISAIVLALIILTFIVLMVYSKITDLRRSRRAREDSARRQQGR